MISDDLYDTFSPPQARYTGGNDAIMETNDKRPLSEAELATKRTYTIEMCDELDDTGKPTDLAFTAFVDPIDFEDIQSLMTRMLLHVSLFHPNPQGFINNLNDRLQYAIDRYNKIYADEEHDNECTCQRCAMEE